MLLLLSLSFSGSIFRCITAYAGNLNSNEQSVVSVIKGQFEKDGIVYKVRQEYIDSAIRYLQQDDVDLTGEQSQAAISEIYANVQTGIESGYLEAVGRTDKAADGRGEEEAASPKAQDAEEGITAEADNQAGRADEGREGQGEADNDTAAANPHNGGQDETETETETETEEATQEAQDPPEIISILELVDKAPPRSYEYLSRDTNALMEGIHIPYRAAGYLIFFLAVIMFVIAVIAFVMKLFACRRHQKLRHCLKYILAGEASVLYAIVLMIAGLWIGAFQDSAVLNKLAETRYYNAILDELRHDTSISFALLDIPDDVMDHALTYERVVLAARQQVESDLGRKDYHADAAGLTDNLGGDIEAYLEGKSITMTEQAEIGLNELMSRLEQKYASLLQWPFASWWLDLKTEFFSFVKIALPLSMLLAAISQALILFLNHYKHRGTLLCGRSLIAGGIITAVAFDMGLVVIRERMPLITPEYMKLFFQFFGNGLCWTGIIIGSIGILIGLLCLIGVRSWKDNKL